jgi:hypothetical protein
MDKIDLKREMKELYRPSASKVVGVEVPKMRFLMLDGQGDPNTSQEYGDAVEALFAASYALKFAVKKEREIDYGVMPLEGLWWAEDMESFASGDRSAWLWTMMIMQPEWVDVGLVERITHEVSVKKDLRALPLMRIDSYDEGLAAQTLHVGPFSVEAPTIERVHDYIDESGYRRDGKHHEIYLSDIRRADPAKWKTVIRQPMR